MWKLAAISLALLHHVACFTKATCFTSRTDIFLRGHVVSSAPSSHISECWQVCKQNAQCQSLNYFVKRRLCEINNRTIDLAPKHMVNVSYAAYFDNPYRGKYWCHEVGRGKLWKKCQFVKLIPFYLQLHFQWLSVLRAACQRFHVLRYLGLLGMSAVATGLLTMRGRAFLSWHIATWLP